MLSHLFSLRFMLKHCESESLGDISIIRITDTLSDGFLQIELSVKHSAHNKI